MKPHSEELEKATLGVLLLCPDLIPSCGLVPQDFHVIGMRKIYEAMRALHRDGSAIDVETVARASGKGIGEVAELDLHANPASWETYRKDIVDLSVRRRLWDMAETVRNRVRRDRGGEVASWAITEAQEALASLNEEGPASALECLDNGEPEVIEPTGIEGLDTRLGGGFGRTWSIVVAGYAGAGKTSFAASVARSYCIRGGKALFISMEMTGRQIADRCVRMEGGDYEAAREWMPRLGIQDRPFRGADDVVSEVYKAGSATDGPGLIILDHLQKIPVQDTEYMTLRKTTGALASAARENKVSIMALSQLSRADRNKTPPPPSLSGLRGSGSIEQDADVVLGVWRPEQFNVEGRDEILILKQRHGAAGGEGVPLDWWPERCLWL